MKNQLDQQKKVISDFQAHVTKMENERNELIRLLNLEKQKVRDYEAKNKTQSHPQFDNIFNSIFNSGSKKK